MPMQKIDVVRYTEEEYNKSLLDAVSTLWSNFTSHFWGITLIYNIIE